MNSVVRLNTSGALAKGTAQALQGHRNRATDRVQILKRKIIASECRVPRQISKSSHFRQYLVPGFLGLIIIKTIFTVT
jgi:hypothetical protein